jgi:hypothetical protein
MENGTSLDDILSSEPTVETASEPETIGRPRDEHGRFASQEPGEQEQPAIEPEAPQDGPPPSDQEPAHIPFAALKDEREKRQRAEAERQQVLERLQQYEAYYQQQNAPASEEDADPVALIAAQVQQMMMPQVQQQILTARVEVAETLARQKWADYDEKVEHFKEAVKANPYLLQELTASPNPAEYAYNAANKMLEAKQYGTATPSREQLEAEIRQKIMAEIGIPNRQAPTSLANERSIGSRSGPAWSGPTPLSDILG